MIMTNQPRKASNRSERRETKRAAVLLAIAFSLIAAADTIVNWLVPVV